MLLEESIMNRDQTTQTTSEWIMGINGAGRGPVLGMYYLLPISLPPSLSLVLYTLFCNNSKVSVGLRTLSDGDLLVLLNGGSLTVYWREEVGWVTCLISENQVEFDG